MMKGDVSMAVTGGKPGKGGYLCLKCGEATVLKNSKDTLPSCPKCNGTTFVKIG
jgi:DNA-directed RNA polymerase subunit RPC12/RpoP